ncbi:MAG: SDR family oxidoreductase [Gemmatimonadetes bacterium]|nr:SDR family oxidoreductase [Gemmatimonadota bacterium]
MTAGTASPLVGRRAVVTGASRGIGAALVRELVAAGVAVAGVSRPGSTAVGGHRMVHGDLATPEGVATVLQGLRAWAPDGPDLLVNAAGVFPNATAERQDPAEFAQTMAINVNAAFALTHWALPLMKARGSGDIVSVGSVADSHAWPGNSAYAASKFGLRALHEVVRAETRGTGVRAILVSPSATDTDAWNAHEAQLGIGFPARSEMLAAGDVARAIVYAVSQPPHVTIEALRITRS